MWSQNNPKIYYNSVYLSGTGQNKSGSAAFYIYNSCSNVEAKNNVLVNTRDESPYCASSVYDYTTSNLTSNYNDLYYSQNQNNCMVRIGGSNYNTLVDWQVTTNDINSVTEMPNFMEPDLHIDINHSTFLDGGATSIAEVTDDIDGDPLKINPDIGADEFVVVPVELISFTATSQAGKVTLNWSTTTELNNLGFEIERKQDNNTWVRIGFKEGHGTTTQPQKYSYTDDVSKLKTATIFYRLKQIDFDGRYEYSDEVFVGNPAPTDYTLHQNYPNPFNP